MKNLYLLAFGTFGHPNDFRQTVFSDDKLNIAKQIKTFDININAIKIFPNGKLYAIRKEKINGLSLISYSIYSHAKEQNSEREGTFIGSSFVFINEIPEENFILSKLNEFHKGLIENNLQNNILKVKHSKDFLIPKIDDIDKFSFQTRKIGSLAEFNSTDSQLILFTRIDNSNLQKKLKSGVDLLNIYDSIFFTDNKEIIDFSRNRNIYKTIDESGFDQEIQNLQEKRKQKRTDAIAKFERNKLQLEEEKNREIENRKKQIEQNQQKQSENQKKIDESRNDLSKFENLYQKFSTSISVLMSGLHTGKNLDEISNSYKQLEKEFNDEKRKLGSSSQISSFSNPRSSAQVSPYSNPYEKSYHRDSEEDEKKGSMKVVAIVSLVLNILLIGALAYLLYSIYTDNEKKIADTENIPSLNEGSDFNESDSVLVESKLNPFPNDVAKNQENKVEMLKKFDSTSTMKNVIDIIFERNKSIKEVYQFQKNDYKKLLFERNKNAFDVKNGDTILVKKDLLEEIPSYTKLK